MHSLVPKGTMSKFAILPDYLFNQQCIPGSQKWFPDTISIILSNFYLESAGE